MPGWFKIRFLGSSVVRFVDALGVNSRVNSYTMSLLELWYVGRISKLL